MEGSLFKHEGPSPEGARAKVEEIVAVDRTTGNFGYANVVFSAVPGTLEREAALQISGIHGTTLVLNDLVGNIRDATGFSGWFLRMMKFAGDEPHIPTPVRWKLVSSKAHGAIIDDKPGDVLRNLANSLT